MSSMRMSLGEAAQEINAMQQMGVDVSNVVEARMGTGAAATAAGVGRDVMMQAGQMGASMAVSMGMRGVTGMQFMQRGMIAGGIAGSQMDPALFNMMGGQMGIAQSIAQARSNFIQGPLATMLGMGGMGNMQAMLGGQCSSRSQANVHIPPPQLESSVQQMPCIQSRSSRQNAPTSPRHSSGS